MKAQTLRQQFRRWAIRAPVPEAQPVFLRHARVYVLPSKTGLGVIITLLAMLIAAINYNLSLGYALTFFLGSVGVVHILHTWRTLTRLQLALQPEGEAFAGGLAHWQLQAFNAHAQNRPAIRILDETGKLLAYLDVPSRGSAVSKVSLPCPQRGLQNPGMLCVETRQPLGWIRAWSYLEPDSPHIIFPAPTGNLPQPRQAGEQAEGGSGLIAGQDDFAGLRSFQPGDSLRHVAWKQLAQGRGMMTKTFASAHLPACVLDWQSLPSAMPVEARLSQLARWVLDARQSGTRTTLRLPGTQIGPGHNASHHQACLRSLALFSKSGHD